MNVRDDVVFSNKYTLINTLFDRLDDYSKIGNTLYLLYAHYGSTYGSIDSDEYEGALFPKRLFDADFEADMYGVSEKGAPRGAGKQHLVDSDNQSFDTVFDDPALATVRIFIENILDQINETPIWNLVDLIHQDDAWLDAYANDENHDIDNDKIINEYIQRI